MRILQIFFSALQVSTAGVASQRSSRSVHLASRKPTGRKTGLIQRIHAPPPSAIATA
ncbi:MAG: hypothetical protein ACI3VN_08350 [Candidatus Onthomonas sp.]